MFERFSATARDVVIDAQQQAARLRHERIGAEHLLLAVLATDTSGARVLSDLGADPAAITAQVPGRDVADAEALRALGIDVDEVRRRVDHAFGSGSLDAEPLGRGWFGRRRRLRHIPFTRGAKKALENALREATSLHHRRIGTEHLVLGLLADPDGVARRILAATGVQPTQDDARAAVLRAVEDPA